MDFKTLSIQFKDWLSNTYEATTNLSTQRSWCLLGFKDKFTQENISKYFDRKNLNDLYKTRYNEGSAAKKEPYAYLQAEISLIANFHKAFVIRHKTRLQSYRDDCVQKRYNTYSAISIGEGKLQFEKEKAEEKR